MTKILVSALLLGSLGAWGMQDQTYGLGGSTTGRASGVTAETDNAYASLLNPALLAATPQKRFGFSITWVGTQLQDPTDVIIDSRKYLTRTGDDRTGRAEIPQVKTALWAAGYNHPFRLGFWPNHRAGIGLALSGPFEQFRRWVALSAYDFSALRYGTADTQFKGTISTGLEIIPEHLYIGAGLSLFLTSSGSTTTGLNTVNPTTRMVMDVAFNTAPVLGLFGRLGSWSTGLVFRQSINPAIHQTFVGTVEVGGMDVANQPAEIQASMYYEPAIVEWDVQRHFSHYAVASVGVSYQRWSGYQPRYLDLSTIDASGRSHSTVPSNVPMRDTWNPRASLEWRGLQDWRFALGYQFRPTAVVDLSGPGNLLDANAHVAGLSVDYHIGPALSMDDVGLSLYGQTQILEPRVVTKAQPDFIGAPGYTIKGRGWAMGLALTALL